MDLWRPCRQGCKCQIRSSGMQLDIGYIIGYTIKEWARFSLFFYILLYTCFPYLVSPSPFPLLSLTHNSLLKNHLFMCTYCTVRYWEPVRRAGCQECRKIFSAGSRLPCYSGCRWELSIYLHPCMLFYITHNIHIHLYIYIFIYMYVYFHKFIYSFSLHVYMCIMS